MAAQELADLIVEQPAIQRYREAEARMQSNPEALAMIRRLRDVQEEIGEYMSRRVPEQHYRHLMDESESILAKLESIPDVQAFVAAQTEVNELLQAVTARLSSALTTPADGGCDNC
ncbi:MAG: YlbF family regulator [Alicyclobacillus sp.]|nr:YlbF family regulator [Alicyclobacillus sp.]